MSETGLVEVTIRATFFIAIGLIAARFVERRSATLSHRVLAVTGLCVVLLPIINLIGPRWEWTCPEWLAGNGAYASSQYSDVNLIVENTDTTALGGSSHFSSIAQAKRMGSWFGTCLSVWIVGSCFMLARLVYACWQLNVSLERCTAPTVAIEEEVRSMAKSFGINDRVQIKFALRESMPMVCWFGRWYLVLPSNIESWAPQVRHATLSHELGHIARRDGLVDYAIQALSCLLWWHPLIRIMERAVTRLRELACDEWVLQTCHVSALHYSHALLDVVRRCQAENVTLAAPMATNGELEDRLRSIASPNRTKKVQSFWLFLCAALMVVLCLGFAAFKLVSKSSISNLGTSVAEWSSGVPTMKSGGSTVTGLVTYEGNPVAGIELKVFKNLERKPIKLHAIVTTDNQGRYRITDMHPGERYHLEVTPKGGLMVRNWQYQSPYVVTVKGADGDTIELPDAILVSNSQILEGVVVDPTGQPVPEISVSANLASGQMLSRPVEGPEPWTKTDRRGRFSLSTLPDQPIELMAYKADPAGGRIVHPSKLKVDLNARDIRIVFDPKLGTGIEDLDAK